jgi:tetratricopeptide (TPR) repeat protein
MKILFVIAIIAFAGVNSYAQRPGTPPDAEAAKIQAQQELNDAALAYNSGKFAEAEKHSELAMALDPDSKVAPAFWSRSIHAQYRPGLDSEENRAIAQRAIAAYRTILQRQPDNVECQIAVVSLSGALGDQQQLMLIGGDVSFTAQARALAYDKLSANFLDSARTMLEQVNNDPGSSKQSDPEVNAKALTLTGEAFRLNELGLGLEPDRLERWQFKLTVLTQLLYLARLGQRSQDEPVYGRQVVETQEKVRELERKPVTVSEP